MAADSKIEEVAARVRAANVLGRSEPLKRLFDFLVARSADPITPKEAEVAAEIMAAGAFFDASQNASVRVYAHRLRQRLEDYCAGPGADDAERLTLPKGGGYRLVLEPRLAPSGEQPTVQALPDATWRSSWRWAAAGVALLLINGFIWLALWPRPIPIDELARVRASPIWQGVLQDRRPVTLVVGDYYIFGEMLSDAGGSRLVRDYAINSPEELDTYLMEHPAMTGRYVNLDLFYLPVSIAGALKTLMPVLAADKAGSDRVHVVQSSDLTADQIKNSDVIYIGYLSGLGLLRDAVFSGSRFSVGSTYDELIDNTTHNHYESQEGGLPGAGEELRDYGYFSTFPGPDGSRIMVVAGTRDTAVIQTVEAIASQNGLSALSAGAGKATAFEALYEVRAVKHMSLGGRLITVSPLHTDKIWSTQPSRLHFPNG
jgi:hypothetical protein